VTLGQLIHEVPRTLARELPAHAQHLKTQQQPGSPDLAQAGVAGTECLQLCAQVTPGGIGIRHQLFAIERLKHREPGSGSHRISTKS
jgi:hypothetical protein